MRKPKVRRRVALATCATLPELDPDDRLLLEPLAELGIEAEAAVWDDPSVDWSAYDLVVIRSTWDYTGRRQHFVDWARRVPRLLNPADVVAWNTDKRYLLHLASAGLPVVPTTWMDAAGASLPADGIHVLKPAIGAGSVDARRFALHDAHEAELARQHAARLIAAGKTVMLQPYLDSVERAGETAVIVLGGVYSHSIRKGAMLASAQPDEAGGLYRSEEITTRDPSPAEIALARRALSSVPGGPDRLAYARVDLVPGVNGGPLIMELELTEPSLFMSTAPGSARRFAEVIDAAARS